MGKYVNSFDKFIKLNEGLSTKDAKQTIKDIFDKFDGIVDDKYLKDMWKNNSTLRNLYGKDLFDKAWDELVDDGTIETEDGKEWCWCSSKKKKEAVNEEFVNDDALELSEEEQEGAEKIEGGANEFTQRYRLKDGRIVDVSPSGKMFLVKGDRRSVRRSQVQESVNESTEYVSELMDKFDIDLEKASRLDEIVDELLSMDDIDDRMDFVEGLTLEFDYEGEEDKLDEIMEYLKDMCIG